MRKYSSPEQNHRVSSPQWYRVLRLKTEHAVTDAAVTSSRCRIALLSFEQDASIPSFLPLREKQSVKVVTQSKTIGPVEDHSLSVEGCVRCDLII